MLNRDILLEFEDLTKFPIIRHFEDFVAFMQSDYLKIVDYYSGNNSQLDSSALANLTQLQEEIDTLLEIFKSSGSAFNNFKWWDLLEQIEINETKLLSISNISKWLRSTVSVANFSSGPEAQISFRQGQTLESINRQELGSEDWDNNWQDIAYKNNLREEDYTTDGGEIIKANYNSTTKGFVINSIVDNPQGDKVLGIDINRNLSFIDNDLDTLSAQLTFLQNIDILSKLRVGDNPEFPQDGLEKSLIIGSNINSIAYPILFRQLTALFKQDDTIGSFVIKNIEKVQDGLFINFEVSNRLGEIQSLSINI